MTSRLHPADTDDEQHPDDHPIAGPAASLSRSQEFSLGLQVRAAREGWHPGEVEAMERERTRSRRD